MSEFVEGHYRGFRYTITWTKQGKAYLHVEGYRAPAKCLYEDMAAAKEGLRRWADFALAQYHPPKTEETQP